MRTETAFWDTSAIIPLCCRQSTTLVARRTARKYRKVTIWWGTPVEMTSALTRLRQAAELNSREERSALHQWIEIRTNARIMQATERVLSIAVELPEKFGLRALDSFQLAAALEWCSERPRNRPFVCADKRLGNAADEAGFDVVSLI